MIHHPHWGSGILHHGWILILICTITNFHCPTYYHTTPNMKIFSCCLILFLASSEASAFMIAPSSQSSSGIAKQQQCINPIIKHLNKNRQSYMSTSSLHVSIGGYATTGAVNTVLSSLKIRHPAKVLVLLLTAATTILLVEVAYWYLKCSTF